MRSLSTKLGAVALVALLLSPLFAQRGRGPGGPPLGPALLFNKSVQEELKLTDEQKSAVTKIREKQTEAFKKAFEDKDKEGFQAATEAATKSLTKVQESLTPAQAKRFKQIELQVLVQTGALGALVNNKELAKDLSLTDKQKDDIKALADDLQKDVVEIFKDAGKDKEKRQEATKKVEGMRKQAMEKVSAMLTEEQKKAWTDMVGPKFDYKPEPFGFGGRGGRPKKDK
jgi:Spy/CpxP family protein refolding chaperone